MGKEKKEKVISKKVSREFSSGGVVFKKINNNLVWLVTKSMPSDLFPKAVWRLPKGWIDDTDGGRNPGPLASGMIKAGEGDLKETAIREVKEEGGVQAKVISKIGTIKFFYKHPIRGNIFKFVTFFLMEWQKDLAEGFDGETSEIAWLRFEKAVEILSSSNEKQILKKAQTQMI